MLADTLRKVISDSYVLYFKAHSFHWNIEGPDFAQYHEFLAKYYEEVFESIDVYAELVRTLQQYAPTSLSRLLQLSEMEEASTIPDAVTMLNTIKNDNSKFLEVLRSAYLESEEAKQYGIANYLQDRIQAHEKHQWMFEAITK